MDGAEQAGEGEKVVLLIKSPMRLDSNFSITVSKDATIGDVQQLLFNQYEGHPAPSEQTVS